MNQQNISDYVFPIITTVKLESGEIEYKNLMGTGFLIGQNNFCLTASHVVHQCQEKSDHAMMAIFASNGKWVAYNLRVIEHHPTEDVCLLVIVGMPLRKSFISISTQSENSSLEVMAWGYPIYIAKEIQYLKTKESDPNERPALIYFSGYIRRRISNPLGHMGSIGSNFYEIDRALGNGVSGAPILAKKSIGTKWSCVGVYVSERGDRADQHGIAVRTDSICNRKPHHWTKTITEESES